MTEPTTTEPPAPAPPAPVPPAPPAGQTVPYDRFKEVNEELKSTRTQLEDLTKWKDEQEQKNLSELERERKERAKAETRASELESKLTNMERSALVRKAALSAEFVDPEDAVSMLDLTQIDDEEKAKAAVEKLAEEKDHLVKKAGPTPIGAPLRPGTPDAVPVGPDGKPDMAAGLGRDMLRGLFGR